MSRFIVMTSSAKMPLSIRVPYMNVAVIETDGIGIPKMISLRAQHVKHIICYWAKCHKGRHPHGNTEFERVLRDANAMCANFNRNTDQNNEHWFKHLLEPSKFFLAYRRGNYKNGRARYLIPREQKALSFANACILEQTAIAAGYDIKLRKKRDY